MCLSERDLSNESANITAPTENHWPATLNAIRDPAFVHDREFRVLHANRPYAALADMEMAAIVGRPYWEAFPRGTGPLPACAAAMPDPPHEEIAEELRLESGRIFHSRSFALFDAAGAYHASVHILEDITEQRRQEADLRYRKNRMEEVERVFHLGTWERDFTTDRPRWSEQMLRIFGFPPGETTPTYAAVLNSVHPEDRERVDRAVKNTLETRAPYDIVFRIVRPDQTVRIVHAAAETVTGPDGRVERMVGTCQDITEAYRAEQQLKELNRTYRTISRCNRHLIRAMEENTLAQDLCDTMVEEGGYRMAWVGYALHDEAKTIVPFAYAGAESGYLKDLKLTWADNERGSGPGARCIRQGILQVTRDILNDPRFAFWREDATRRGYASSIAIPLKNSEGSFGFLGMYSVTTDAFDEEEVGLLVEVADDLAFGITAIRERAERDALTRELAYLATHDRLTGLANRTVLVDHLQQAMFYARRYGRGVAVVCIDLDNFKLVNDSLGTSLGDEFLQETARRLRDLVPENDTIARLASGEFMLVLADQESAADTASRLAEILAAVREPVNLGGKEITVTGSIGCSFYPADGEEHEILLRRAKVTAHRAKEAGGDTAQFFAVGLDADATERLEIQAELRRAVQRDELVLHYQPQVSLRTGKLVGLEALMRWRRPQQGLISPASSFPSRKSRA